MGEGYDKLVGTLALTHKRQPDFSVCRTDYAYLRQVKANDNILEISLYRPCTCRGC